MNNDPLQRYFSLCEGFVEREFKFPKLVAPIANKVTSAEEILDRVYEIKSQALAEMFPEPQKVQKV